jgi:hypothetical protein
LQTNGGQWLETGAPPDFGCTALSVTSLHRHASLTVNTTRFFSADLIQRFRRLGHGLEGIQDMPGVAAFLADNLKICPYIDGCSLGFHMSEQTKRIFEASSSPLVVKNSRMASMIPQHKGETEVDVLDQRQVFVAFGGLDLSTPMASIWLSSRCVSPQGTKYSTFRQRNLASFRQNPNPWRQMPLLCNRNRHFRPPTRRAESEIDLAL